MKNKKVFLRYCRLSMICLFSSLLLNACVVGGAGYSRALQGSMEVENSFQEGTVLSDHSYFYQGTSSDPEAIIALVNPLQLQSRLWSQVDMTEKQLKEMVFWMRNKELGLCSTNGGYLVTPAGVQIGVWYSTREITTIKQPEPGVVEVYPFDYIPGSPCYGQYRSYQR